MFILVLLTGVAFFYLNFYKKGLSVLTDKGIPFGVAWVFCLALYSVFLRQNCKVPSPHQIRDWASSLSNSWIRKTSVDSLNTTLI